MNIPILQNYFLKKNIDTNKTLKTPNNNKIKKVILLIDESQQDYKTKILLKMKEFGFIEEYISILVFVQKIEKGKIYEFPTFSNESFSLFGEIKSKDLSSILNLPFDLLISFYKNNIEILEFVSQKINADFKICLSKSNNLSSHLMVNCSLNEIKTYISESVKYLKILNKL